VSKAKMLGVVALSTFGGCAMFSNAVGPTLKFADCVWATYSAEPAGRAMVDVITDIGLTCGGDIPAIVNVLNSKEPPALHSTAGAHTLTK